ncbi:MAG TPA: hypothetical protein VG497_13045 [Kribbella sp.]|nr:hypothetical protein [Kribbella sp.]
MDFRLALVVARPNLRFQGRRVADLEANSPTRAQSPDDEIAQVCVLITRGARASTGLVIRELITWSTRLLAAQGRPYAKGSLT